MQKKSTWLILAFIMILLVTGIIYYFVQANKNAREDVSNQLTTILQKQNFEKLPSIVTDDSLKKQSYTTNQLIEKYSKIYNGLSIKNVTVSNKEIKKNDNGDYVFNYTLNMTTALGKLVPMDYTAPLTKVNGDYKIQWNPTLIFPNMTATDTISYTVDTATRGDIIDVNGYKLATYIVAYEMGIIPGQLGEGKKRSKHIQKIAKAFKVSTATIEKKLNQSWVKDELFVPIKLIDEKEVKDLTAVQYKSVDTRYYSLGEAAANLIGYTGKATAEDLAKDPALASDATIGKAGLEQYYDTQLRGEDGGQIALKTKDGKIREVLLKAERINGETIQLTIDAKVQEKAFQSLKKAKGSTVVMNPKTGAFTALTSSPSYDPNKMVRGISQKDYEKYANDENHPFISRFAQRYAPGSTLKLLTAAIGFDNGTTTNSETHKINGLKWQKDASWGNYFVTRLHEVDVVDYKEALIQSDNIFFAQEGIQMGETILRDGFKRFGFETKLNVPFAMKPSQISNDEKFNSEIALADSSYGQGEVLMSPIQQAVAYSAFANDGKIITPHFLKTDTSKTTQATEKETAKKIKAAMIQVVQDTNGTAHSLASISKNIAAKTGTAELKQSQTTEGAENSLIVAFNAKKENYLLLTIIEDYERSGKSARELSAPLLKLLEK